MSDSKTQDELSQAWLVYSYFEKGCWKKCTRQSRKALWVILSLLFFKEIWKNWYERPWKCVWVLKESSKRRFDRYSRQKQWNDHIPYYLSGLSCAHFSDNLSRNSCMLIIYTVYDSRDSRWSDKLVQEDILGFLYGFKYPNDMKANLLS